MFGLFSECPPEVEVAWGARAILEEGGRIDLLPDRQSWKGEPCPKLARLVNKALPASRRRARELARQGQLDLGSSRTVVLHRDRESGLVVLANPNASYGYLYLVAWQKR